MTIGPARPRRRTAKEHGPDPIDRGVGRQVRLARELAGMTQVNVGSHLGLSFQLVQKYEQGEIRVSASRLYQLACLLQKPVDFFFATTEAEQPPLSEGLGRREMELVQAYRGVTKPEVRERLSQLVKGMSEQSAAPVRKSRSKQSQRPK